MASCFLKQSYERVGVDALAKMKQVAEANGLTVEAAHVGSFGVESLAVQSRAVQRLRRGVQGGLSGDARDARAV